MSQYSTGLASTTNGSATVTGTNTLWLANVTAGDSFTVAGDGVMYDVGSVNTDTSITLSAPYAGTTASGVVYAIGTGFTVPDSFPEMSQGDIETATIFTRAMRKIQGKFSEVVSDISTNTSDIAISVAGKAREDLLKQATLSLDFANNKYEVYEGPVDGLTQMPFNTALDFTRGSGATAQTAIGTIQEVLADEQRLVGNREGLLIEEERTNLLLNSATLSSQDVTVAAEEHTIHFTGTGTVTLSGVFAGSLVGTGTGESNRVSLTFTPTAGTLTATVTGSVVDSQLEQGSSPSSYIPTAGTQVTRAADGCVRVLGDEFNPEAFTVYGEIARYPPESPGDSRFFTLTSGEPDNRITIREAGSNFIIEANDALLLVSTSGALGGIASKFAYSYNSLNDSLVYVVNGEVQFSVTVPEKFVGLSEFWISGGIFPGSTSLNTSAKDFRIFPTALSDAELITLTGGT
jgi:hypothetical protein